MPDWIMQKSAVNSRRMAENHSKAVFRRHAQMRKLTGYRAAKTDAVFGYETDTGALTELSSTIHNTWSYQRGRTGISGSLCRCIH